VKDDMLTDDVQVQARGARSDRWALAAFSATVFCGSFLLFLVQPIVAKELLPWFGGAANVWAVCLVFFQLGLLLGYAYADALARRIVPVRQSWIHLALIFAAATLLPIIPATHWKPLGAENPSLRVLGALATTVGLPYVVMAATSPLVQSWYARRFPTRSPYRLFALSNLASMLALVAYPGAMEPWLGTRWQSYAWSAAYLTWALLICACAATLRNARPEGAAHLSAAAEERPTLHRYLAWAGLAALGSLLLVAVTSHLTRDVAAIPLLWVVPLAIYLLTFIASFQQRTWLTLFRLDCFAVGALLLYGVYALFTAYIDYTLPIDWQVAAYCVVLAGTCLYCHGRLALTRPAPAHLTRFYLTIALGGAVGSALVGLAAPALLHVDFDLEGAMVITATVVAATLWRANPARRPIALAATLAGALTLASAAWAIRDFYDGTVLARRNFYGALRVYDWSDGKDVARSLSNGVILHGTQFLSDDARRRPTEYYAEASGIGHAMAALRTSPGPRRIGVIGLGAGTLAAYGRPGDVIRFYELNPTVVGIARREFTFLGDSAAHVEIALGDARLNLERESPRDFDLIVVDAFSSDAIPVHLLTHEALELYLRHLKREGLVAFHVSNHYLDLEPVVQRLAQASGLVTRLVDAEVTDQFNAPSSWVLVSRTSATLDLPGIASVARRIAPNSTRLWTDDFSDLLEFLR
jgi:hypothetical protein